MAKEQERTLEGLKTAIQMEIDGKRFYQKASQASRNPLGKKLLSTLAEEEDVHRRNFEDIYEGISQKNAWPATGYKPDGGQGLRTIFARALESPEDSVEAIPSELDAVQTAMEMENKTYDFYIAQSKKAAYGAEKDFYEAVAAQEKEHHRVLLDYYEFLKDPAAWFVEKEHPSLDGG
jgi:rubrerythrin